MKKLIAILFLSLICLTTLSGKVYSWDMNYELAMDAEEGENKEGKKDSKEYTAYHSSKTFNATLARYFFKEHKAFIFPQPVIDKQTPPPDFTC